MGRRDEDWTFLIVLAFLYIFFGVVVGIAVFLFNRWIP